MLRELYEGSEMEGDRRLEAESLTAETPIRTRKRVFRKKLLTASPGRRTESGWLTEL